MLDPLCQPNGEDATSTNDGMEQDKFNIPIYIAMFCIGFAVGFFVFLAWKKYGKCFKGL